MIRLIATDLDGTLLAPDGTIPAENVAAIREAHEAGVPFVIATGRPVRWLECLEPVADLRPFVVASNGAVLFDLAEGRVLRHHVFEQDEVRSIVAAVRETVPRVIFGLERGDLFGTEPRSPSDHVNFPGVLQLPIEELIESITPVVKMLVYSRSHSTDALAHAVRRAILERATVTTSLTHDQFGMAELSVPGVTKAHTLAELCAQLGIPASDVVAFGDMPNDLEMLDWAGRAYVTEDAHPALLARYESVGACGQAGVGRAIRELLEAMRS